MGINKNKYPQREELTDEGKILWDIMMRGENTIQTKSKPSSDSQARIVKQVVKQDTAETIRMRLELKKLQQNSRIVIAECEELQKKYIKEECYFKANECRVAAMCHTNFIERMQRILDGLDAFENRRFDGDEDFDTRRVIIVQ